jgi:hypothetical protein
LGFPAGRSFTSSTPRHQQVFWHRCRGLNKKNFPRQLRASKTPSKFSGVITGEKKTSARGVSQAHSLLCFSFALLYFYLHHFIKNTKKLVSL